MPVHNNEVDAFAAIMSNIYEGFPLPDFWTEYNDAMVATFHKCYWRVIEEYGPFFGGHVLRGLGTRMAELVEDSPSNAKWTDYSYHDYTVNAVMNALEGKVTQRKPDFLGAIFFELRTMEDG